MKKLICYRFPDVLGLKMKRLVFEGDLPTDADKAEVESKGAVQYGTETLNLKKDKDNLYEDAEITDDWAKEQTPYKTGEAQVNKAIADKVKQYEDGLKAKTDIPEADRPAKVAAYKAALETGDNAPKQKALTKLRTELVKSGKERLANARAFGESITKTLMDARSENAKTKKDEMVGKMKKPKEGEELAFGTLDVEFTGPDGAKKKTLTSAESEAMVKKMLSSLYIDQNEQAAQKVADDLLTKAREKGKSDAVNGYNQDALKAVLGDTLSALDKQQLVTADMPADVLGDMAGCLQAARLAFKDKPELVDAYLKYYKATLGTPPNYENNSKVLYPTEWAMGETGLLKEDPAVREQQIMEAVNKYCSKEKIPNDKVRETITARLRARLDQVYVVGKPAELDAAAKAFFTDVLGVDPNNKDALAGLDLEVNEATIQTRKNNAVEQFLKDKGIAETDENYTTYKTYLRGILSGMDGNRVPEGAQDVKLESSWGVALEAHFEPPTAKTIKWPDGKGGEVDVKMPENGGEVEVPDGKGGMMKIMLPKSGIKDRNVDNIIAESWLYTGQGAKVDKGDMSNLGSKNAQLYVVSLFDAARNGDFAGTHVMINGEKKEFLSEYKAYVSAQMKVAGGQLAAFRATPGNVVDDAKAMDVVRGNIMTPETYFNSLAEKAAVKAPEQGGKPGEPGKPAEGAAPGKEAAKAGEPGKSAEAALAERKLDTKEVSDPVKAKVDAALVDALKPFQGLKKADLEKDGRNNKANLYAEMSAAVKAKEAGLSGDLKKLEQSYVSAGAEGVTVSFNKQGLVPNGLPAWIADKYKKEGVTDVEEKETPKNALAVKKEFNNQMTKVASMYASLDPRTDITTQEKFVSKMHDSLLSPLSGVDSVKNIEWDRLSPPDILKVSNNAYDVTVTKPNTIAISVNQVKAKEMWDAYQVKLEKAQESKAIAEANTKVSGALQAALTEYKGKKVTDLPKNATVLMNEIAAAVNTKCQEAGVKGALDKIPNKSFLSSAVEGVTVSVYNGATTTVGLEGWMDKNLSGYKPDKLSPQNEAYAKDVQKAFEAIYKKYSDAKNVQDFASVAELNAKMQSELMTAISSISAGEKGKTPDLGTTGLTVLSPARYASLDFPTAKGGALNVSNALKLNPVMVQQLYDKAKGTVYNAGEVSKPKPAPSAGGPKGPAAAPSGGPKGKPAPAPKPKQPEGAPKGDTPNPPPEGIAWNQDGRTDGQEAPAPAPEVKLNAAQQKSIDRAMRYAGPNTRTDNPEQSYEAAMDVYLNSDRRKDDRDKLPDQYSFVDTAKNVKVTLTRQGSGKFKVTVERQA